MGFWMQEPGECVQSAKCKKDKNGNRALSHGFLDAIIKFFVFVFQFDCC
jgi:hypothetical protein